jgi:tetratricopeptide (TPR) repeat protein
VLASDLPRDVLGELRELPPERRDELARHLAAAGALLAEQPEAAYQHAAYVKRSAARLASVREAAGVSAYRTGRYAEALRELRAYTRMTGDPRHLPVMADCERGLGRPERALTLARSQNANRLGRAERIELRIVASGARRDLGEAKAALVELRGPHLDSSQVAPWTPRLWYAYAEALLAAGRRADAMAWFGSAATVDSYGETDADARLAALAEPDGDSPSEPSPFG